MYLPQNSFLHLSNSLLVKGVSYAGVFFTPSPTTYPDNTFSKGTGMASTISLQLIGETEEAFHNAILSNNKEMVRGLHHHDPEGAEEHAD